MKKILVVIALVAISLLMFTSCEDNTPKVYTLSFDANSGSGTMPAQIFTEGTAQELTVNSFIAPSCKKFEKWNTKADGTGSDYSNEVSYIATGNTTLYAQWEYLDLEVGDNGQAGIIFYDVDADNDATGSDESTLVGADNLISQKAFSKLDSTQQAQITTAGYKVDYRYFEVAEYDIKLTGNTVDLGASNDRTKIPFAYYKNVGGIGNSMYVNGTATYSAETCTDTAIGTGASNTEKLVAAMKADGSQAFPSISETSTTSNYAANVCSKLEVEKDGTTYSDWFLPSYEELNLMYDNLHDQPTPLGNFTDLSYWSSSEDDSSAILARFIYFLDGYKGSYGRDGEKVVRAIRVF